MILLFCVYVFLRVLFHISAIIKLQIASYLFIFCFIFSHVIIMLKIRFYYSNKNCEMFTTSWCQKSRNRFKNKKFVALAEYFEQQANCGRYRRKMNQSRRSPSWRNQSYLPFLSKQMETMSQSHKQSAT